MGIEQTGATVGTKTSAVPDSRTAKSKSNDAADAPEGGFSSLLNAVASPIETPGEKSDSEVESLAASPKGEKKEPMVDGSLLIPPPIDLMSLATPVVDADKKGTLLGDGFVAEGHVLGALSSTTDGVDKPDRLLTRQGVMPLKAGTSETEIKPADLALTAAQLIKPELATTIDPKTLKILQARQAMGDELRTDVTHARLESRALKAAAELELVGKDAVQSKLSLAGEFAARLLEPVERSRGKAFGSVGATGAEGGWTQYAHHARAGTDVTSNMVATGTTQAQSQMADKVSYWVTQGIQNAQLTLDGFGSDPVEVSILLKGGEAHVGFRTDQPEVRQMLEGALSQLKASLEREGVVLSGVTVGTSGSGAEAGGRQQEQQRDGSPNRNGGAGQAAQEIRVVRTPTSVGRSLDIFV